MAKNSGYSPDDLPSYSESISTPQTSSATLPQNIAQARSALVSSLLATHITPHLHSSSLSGLSSTTLLLVPSNVSSLQPPTHGDTKGPSGDGPKFPGESVEGFYSTDNLTIIRMHGRQNSSEFWRQPAVIRVLEQQLQTQMRKDGHRVVGVEELAEAASSNGAAKSHGGFFKRKASNVEWKMPEVEQLGDGEVRTGVEMKDICLRIENEMGLYETRTGKAVVVKVDVGG